jgi:hypothetical protein
VLGSLAERRSEIHQSFKKLAEIALANQADQTE